MHYLRVTAITRGETCRVKDSEHLRVLAQRLCDKPLHTIPSRHSCKVLEKKSSNPMALEGIIDLEGHLGFLYRTKPYVLSNADDGVCAFGQ